MANLSEKVWWIETESETADELNDPQLGLATYSRVGENVTYTHLEGSKTIKVYGSVYDEDFVESGTGIALSESPNIPSQFHEGLAHYVIMKGYENNISKDPQALQKVGYFRNYWKSCKECT